MTLQAWTSLQDPSLIECGTRFSLIGHRKKMGLDPLYTSLSTEALQFERKTRLKLY